MRGGLDLVGPRDGQSFCSCASKMAGSGPGFLYYFFSVLVKSKSIAGHCQFVSGAVRNCCFRMKL